MKVCFAVLHYDERVAEHDVAAYLRTVPVHRALPREVAALGHDVDVVHLYPRDTVYAEDGVTYHFIASGRVPRAAARVASGIRHGDAAAYEPAWRAIDAIRALRPDIIHVHGIGLNLNLFLLYRALGRTRPPVVLHYHGGYPAVSRIGRALQRANFRRAARLLFTTHTHAQPFIDGGVLDNDDRIVDLMETSSDFAPIPRGEARRRTGMAGEPVFLWVGRLDPVKDPLTALQGFARILDAWPHAELYMYYRTDALLPQMRAFCDGKPHLAQHVHFRGAAPYERMPDIYSSTDFLLQASHREFSGCAVLEAMACGVIPVVTDIPSFRAMTAGGCHGVLFPPGCPNALAAGVLRVPPAEIPARSAAVRKHFHATLSFPALAWRLAEVYAGVV
ncbi:MAG: glycosyltransferase family 4 protein [Anaerolineae bacterium]